MVNKEMDSADEALSDIQDEAVIMVGGFGPAGQPTGLIDALIRRNARGLTLISNNAGNGDYGLAALLKAGCVKRMICSFPRQADSWVFDELYRQKKIELELVPQGNLVARIQAAGAGLGAIFTPTAYGTRLAEGKETRLINGRHYVLELPLSAHFSLIKAQRADRWGNLTFNKTGRNFGPIMAAASRCTIAEVSEMVPLGALDPEAVITPGIYVKRVVHVPAVQTRLIAQDA
ncbi:3-oxoacid CoA-transferase subunit A [Martelella alba]|uniref:3-oxoacid CoA-transferase subunit A n=1 Tax=Martelella alba TaxID=2590451 RepID=A0ABY2SPU2_9HYPH|nr:3-oxoacid CoA-transferase subunit A [Martelella alba]TKI07901.1 3-oxoacid CoA-transferase subunit A [Martelella alba]